MASCRMEWVASKVTVWPVLLGSESSSVYVVAWSARSFQSNPVGPAAPDGIDDRVRICLECAKLPKPARQSVVSAAHSGKRSVPTILVGVAAGLVLMSGAAAPQLAWAENAPPDVLETEIQIDNSVQQLNYLIEQKDFVKRAELAAKRQQLKSHNLRPNSMPQVQHQKDLVKRAELAAKRQQLKTQVVEVETTLQRKDERRLKNIEAETAELEEKARLIQGEAAKLDAQISRAEMLEKVRTLNARQQVLKAASEAKSASPRGQFSNSIVNPGRRTQSRPAYGNCF
eukprot:gene6701-3371_t